MSNKSDKALLTKGAEEIREAERELQESKPHKLDGTLASVVKKINRLHNEILAAAKMSLEKAIEVGELLSRVRDSRKGKWLAWLEDNVSFSRRTAYNYISCFKRRESLQMLQISDLSDAYALLNAPKSKQSNEAVEQLVSKGIAKDERTARRMIKEQTHANSEQTPPQSKPQRHKSKQSIIDQISRDRLEGDLKTSQIKIDSDLGELTAQITRQGHAAWKEFPARLITRGQDFIKQGERLNNSTTQQHNK